MAITENTITSILSVATLMTSPGPAPVCMTYQNFCLNQCPPDLDKVINIQFFATLIPIVLAISTILNIMHSDYKEEFKNSSSLKAIKNILKRLSTDNGIYSYRKNDFGVLYILIASVFILQIYLAYSC